MEETLLELLCAPRSHAALRLANSVELGQINSQIRQRLIRNRDGFNLDVELDGSLVCESERTCYPIRDGLPILISGEAFDWPPNRRFRSQRRECSIKWRMRRWSVFARTDFNEPESFRLESSLWSAVLNSCTPELLFSLRSMASCKRSDGRPARPVRG